MRVLEGYRAARFKGEMMAVTRYGNVIEMTAASDALTGKFELIAAQLEHTAAANAIIQNTATRPQLRLRTTTTVLRDWIDFPGGFIVDGLLASTLSAGTLTFYLK
jgi:hypothetical protein